MSDRPTVVGVDGVRRPMTDDEYAQHLTDAAAAAEARKPPTAEELAAQLDQVAADTSADRLAIRAIISLLADRLGVDDRQAISAVRERMREIAAGERQALSGSARRGQNGG